MGRRNAISSPLDLIPRSYAISCTGFLGVPRGILCIVNGREIESSVPHYETHGPRVGWGTTPPISNEFGAYNRSQKIQHGRSGKSQTCDKAHRRIGAAGPKQDRMAPSCGCACRIC
jgi:hypothetical protein